MSQSMEGSRGLLGDQAQATGAHIPSLVPAPEMAERVARAIHNAIGFFGAYGESPFSKAQCDDAARAAIEAMQGSAEVVAEMLEALRFYVEVEERLLGEEPIETMELSQRYHMALAAVEKADAALNHPR